MPAEHLQLQIVDVRPPLSFGDLEVNMRTGLLTGRNVRYLGCVGRGGYLSGPSDIVIHFTAGPGDARKSIQAMNQRRVSSHLVINRDGSIMQGVPFTRVAFHAGKGVWWHFHDNMNSNSIGIELCNLKLGIRPRVPYVFFNATFWADLRQQLSTMIQSRRAPAWMEDFVLFTDDPDEVVAFYRRKLQVL